MRILILETEDPNAETLENLLEKHKYTVDAVHKTEDALDYILQISYDTLIIDWTPQSECEELLEQIRSTGISTPVLLLEPENDVKRRIAALDAGADDCLSRPFAASEFLARVRALTRRCAFYAPSVLSFGGVQLQCDRCLLLCAGKTVHLNNKEYQLMELFMRNPHCVFSTEHLMEKIWGLDASADIDVVWTYIGYLRRKLRGLCADICLQSIRGVGYSLEEAASDKDADSPC